MFLTTVYEMPHPKMNYPELITWLLGTATIQEKHPFHGTTMPDWVPGAARFRQHAEVLTQAVKAAENKDTQKGRERDQEHAAALLSINTNACYIVMRSQYEKDESLLYNMGYEVKGKMKRSHAAPSVSKLPLQVFVKRGTEPGDVIVKIQRDPGAALYQIQFCKGVPTGEDSWGGDINTRKCLNVIKNQERASWCYVRARSQGDNETSPWSTPVGVIVG